jgi:HlyD family secretion protein
MKRVLSIVVVLAIIAAVAVWATNKAKAGAPAGLTQYKLAPVDSGMVKKTVSATGTLKPWKVIEIKSKAGGRVDELLVDVGSVVKTGQVLARIDPTDTMLSVNTAQADIDAARAKELQTDRIHRLTVEQTQIGLESARAQLDSAIASRNAAKARLDTARSMSATQPNLTKAAIQQAQSNYENLMKVRQQLDSTQPQEKAASQSAYDQAVANQRNADANLTRQRNLLDKGFVSEQVVDQARATSEVAKAQVDSALQKLKTINAQQTAELEAANARIGQAKAQLDTAKANAVEVDNRKFAVLEAEASLKQWEAQVRTAQTAIDDAKANSANNEVRKLDIASAKAGIAGAKARLTNATTTLDQTTVRSPSEGVILQKFVEQGTMITSGMSFNSTGTSLLQLGDVTKLYVDVTVDETDIAKVREGQGVDVLIDAYPGIPFEGKVARVDPQALVEQNVTTVHVRVEVDNDVPSFRLLKPGMNATCEFVDNKKEDVVRVPNEALRTDDKGKYVEVGTGGKAAPPDPKTGEPVDADLLVEVKIEKRRVNTDTEGLEGNEYTEIAEGLKVGEKIVVQTIEPAPQEAGSPFGGGRMGGFGGGGGRGGGGGGGGGGGRR